MARGGLALAASALGLLVPQAAAQASQQPSFLSAQTDQLGVPGYLPGTEVTPSGSLYTGWAELAFRYGRRLAPTDGSDRELLDGRVPIIRLHMRDGAVAYTITVVCAPAAGRPVDFIRVRWQNTGRRPADAAWATEVVYAGGTPRADGTYTFRFRRPATTSQAGYYAQPGIAFDPGWTWAFRGETLVRSGQTLLRFPLPRAGVRRSELLLPAGRQPASHATPFGRVSYRTRLPPGGTGQLDYALPVVPIPAPAPVRLPGFDRALADTEHSWRLLLGNAISIQVPERKVQDTFYAGLANLALSRWRTVDGQWVQTVNKLQYNASWLRDSAFIAAALDLAGLHSLAGQDIGFFRAWQQPDGLFISRLNQFDGFGEALWAIGLHARWNADPGFGARMLVPVIRAMTWFEAERATDPWHLLPASRPGDDELTTGHITGDNLLAVDGINEAAALARRLGRVDLASRWGADRDRLRADLLTRLTGAEARSRGAIPPALEANGGEDWGNLWASYPEPVLAPTDRAVSATLRRVRARFRDGIATYYGGRQLHDYIAFRVFETELLRGEQTRVTAGLYSELAHTTATGGGFEIGVSARGPRQIPGDLAPHGWFAAEYMTLLRNMLVREDGARLVLLSAVPAGWLRPGRRISVSRADTLRGQISFALRATSGGATLRWRARLSPGTELVWPVPAAARDVRAAELRHGAIVLHGGAGTLRVRWRLHGPFPDAASTSRAILASYPAG